MVFIEHCNVNSGRERILEICKLVEDKLTGFKDFLTVKSHTNFSMASYLEEFPGLVHFIHVDRSAGRVIAPNIEEMEELSINIKRKVRIFVIELKKL